MKLSRVGASVAMTAIAALALAGCASGNDTGDTAPSQSTATSQDTTSSSTAATTGSDTATTGSDAAPAGDLSGSIKATGASSQEKAELNAWVPGFQAVQPNLTVEYTPTGSGQGRDNFQAGTSDFIGSDRAFNKDEIEKGPFKTCKDGTDIVEFPAYISPIAIGYNLPGVDELKLDGKTLADIYMGNVTNWNDPAIASQNEGVTLPDLPINPVHRGDGSGTTANFSAYLAAASGGDWTYDAVDDFPEGLPGEAAQQTAGVHDAIAGGEGSIGYLDASQAGDLQTVSIKSGDEYVPYSPEAAAKVVAGSPLDEGRAPTDIVYALDYTGVPGAYPIVLVSYLIGCTEYASSDKAPLVQAYFNYVITADAQNASAKEAGNAPISPDTAKAAADAIATIK